MSKRSLLAARRRASSKVSKRGIARRKPSWFWGWEDRPDFQRVDVVNYQFRQLLGKLDMSGMEFDEYLDDEFCRDCGESWEMCGCSVKSGMECGRWVDGEMLQTCLKAGSEECDWECPHAG